MIKINNSFLILLTLLVIVMSSCTKLIYSHSDYMKGFNTKQDVIQGFGLPNEKVSEGEYTQWLYDFGSRATGIGLSTSNTNANITGIGNTIYGNSNTNANMITHANYYKRYVKFTFDNNDRVVSWNSQAVNFEKKKPAPFNTILCIILSLGGGILMGVLTAG